MSDDASCKPEAGPKTNRRSFLMATASSAAVPLLAGSADGKAENSELPSTIRKSQDLAVSVNGYQHQLSLDPAHFAT